MLCNSACVKSGALYNSDDKNFQVNTDTGFKPLSTYEELTSTEISAIPSGQRDGRFIFDTDTSDLKFGVNDSFLTVTTT